MPFKITNTTKKNVVEQITWVKTLKNGSRIYFEEEMTYRWGEVIVEDDPRENGWEAGDPLISDDFSRVDANLTDGCHSSRIGIDELSKKEQQLLESADYPDDAGWEIEDCQIIFYDDIEIEACESL